MDDSLVDAYEQYNNSPISLDRVLGFEIDHRVHDFSMLHDDYKFEQCNFNTRQVPGMLLRECVDMVVVRAHRRDGTNSFHFNMQSHSVGVSVMYNGSEMIVTHLHSDSTELLLQLKYIEIVLLLYRQITGTTMGAYCYKYESELAVSNIVPIEYVPTTVTYMESLEAVVDANVSGQEVHINTKHDGIAVWAYLSPTTPLSLLYQTKQKRHVSHRYIGVLQESVNVIVQHKYCMLMERLLLQTGAYVYVVLDCFSGTDRKYRERMSEAVSLLHQCDIRDVQMCVTNSITVGSGRAINDIMSITHESSDGYVFYTGTSRPIKVKSADMMTLDLEYDKNVSAYTHLHDLGDITVDEPGYEMLTSTTNDKVVVEVNLSTGHIVRMRPDREHGNSRTVVENVLRSYKKDIKYSSLAVWSGVDVKFSVLMNRMFKRYMHCKHMHRSSSMLDVGSGNGGDVGIWKHMRYRVMAVEYDTRRYDVLCRRTAGNMNVKCVRDDMRNLFKHLKASTVRYESASFMRSLSNMNREDLCVLLDGLRAYGCNRILIVTMVRDNLIPHHYSNNMGQRFDITPNDETVTVSYDVGDGDVSYTDNCYYMREWMGMCTSVGYNVRVETQADFMYNVFGVVANASTYPCFTDVGLVLQSVRV